MDVFFVGSGSYPGWAGPWSDSGFIIDYDLWGFPIHASGWEECVDWACHIGVLLFGYWFVLLVSVSFIFLVGFL